MFDNNTVFLSRASAWESLSAWYEESFFKTFLDALNEQYFRVDLGIYENFSVSSTLGTTLRNVVLALAIGIIIAAFMTASTRTGIGGFVRTLLANDCLSPENAKTLSELGYFRNSGVRRDLARGGILRMVVKKAESTDDAMQEEATAGEEEEANQTESAPVENAGEGSADFAPKSANNATRIANKDEKIDFLTARFYIPEDLKYRAEIRFEKKGSGWLGAIITSVLAVITAAVLCALLPDLVQFADNLVTVFSP